MCSEHLGISTLRELIENWEMLEEWYRTQLKDIFFRFKPAELRELASEPNEIAVMRYYHENNANGNWFNQYATEHGYREIIRRFKNPNILREAIKSIKAPSSSTILVKKMLVGAHNISQVTASEFSAETLYSELYRKVLL